MLKKALLFVLILSLPLVVAVMAQDDEDPIVYGIYFYYETCGYCIDFLENELPHYEDEFDEQFQLVQVDIFSREGRALFSAAQERYEFRPYVPVLIVGAELVQGIDDLRWREDGGAAQVVRAGLAEGGVGLPRLDGVNAMAVRTGSMRLDEGGLTHGPLAGEVEHNSAVVWARTDRPGRLAFEVSDTEDFDHLLYRTSLYVDAEDDFIGETTVFVPEPDTRYYYRVYRSDSTPRGFGSFKSAPAPDDEAALQFTFGACLGGQGYCRDPETGWQIFDSMAATAPDFFIFTGDTIYADSACPADSNVPGAEGPYYDLEGYRTRYRYHLEDPHYAAFLLNTPVYPTWDDHEVIDNFGGPELMRLNPQMFLDGQQAFFDYWPLRVGIDGEMTIYRHFNRGAHADFFLLDTRSYRDPLVNWDPSPVTGEHKTMLGAEQFAWLQQSLLASDSTWKFIVSSVPLGYPTGFPQPEVEGRDSWADGGDRSGYETELMRLLYFIESHNIENVVFITGDAHWPYALSFDPDLDGEPNFYEFSSSPLSALPLGPVEVDQTFNPTVLYAEGAFGGDLFNFGHIRVDDAGALTFTVFDAAGEERFSLTLE